MLFKTSCVRFTGFLLTASLQFATIAVLCGQETTLDRVVSGNSPADPSENPASTAQIVEKNSAPPQRSGINITIDPKTGRLIIQSDDPAALDQLEEVMRVNRPPQRPYDVFNVKHARASWVTLNLEEYFEENSGNDDSRFRYFFGFDEPKKDDKRELGKRPPLRFIYDNDTNSIVVIGADDGDRETIRELIKLWDVPEPEDDSVDDARYIELVRVKFSKAESIAASLKETFRDLLSANDKAFQEGDDGESKRESGGDSGGGFSFAYKGKLSIGVDVVTNSILVSAEGQQLLDIVLGLIKQLDDQAQTESEFAVATVPASVNGKSVKEALMRMLAQPKQPDKSKQQAQQQAEQQKQAQQQQQDSRGRSSSRSRGR